LPHPPGFPEVSRPISRSAIAKPSEVCLLVALSRSLALRLLAYPRYQQDMRKSGTTGQHVGHLGKTALVRLRRARVSRAISLVGKLVALAVLVGGCQRRPICTALQPRKILYEDATDAEYMPGYTAERIAAETQKAPPGMEGLVDHEYYPFAVASELRELGEAPLLRLAGNGDGARCLKDGSSGSYTAVGRMLHAPNGTHHYVQSIGNCEGGPAPLKGRRYVGRRYERMFGERAWAKVDQCLRESGFDGKSLEAETEPGVQDAESYFLEAVRGGRYHAVAIDDVSRTPDGKPRPVDCCRLLLE